MERGARRGGRFRYALYNDLTERQGPSLLVPKWPGQVKAGNMQSTSLCSKLRFTASNYNVAYPATLTCFLFLFLY